MLYFKRNNNLSFFFLSVDILCLMYEMFLFEIFCCRFDKSDDVDFWDVSISG